MAKTIQLCLTESGDIYIVRNMGFPKGRPAWVRVWGDVVGYKGTKSTHAPSKTFMKDDVIIEDAETTPELLRDLFAQTKRKLRANGDLRVGPRGGLSYTEGALERL